MASTPDVAGRLSAVRRRWAVLLATALVAVWCALAGPASAADVGDVGGAVGSAVKGASDAAGSAVGGGSSPGWCSALA